MSNEISSSIEDLGSTNPSRSTQQDVPPITITPLVNPGMVTQADGSPIPERSPRSFNVFDTHAPAHSPRVQFGMASGQSFGGPAIKSPRNPNASPPSPPTLADLPMKILTNTRPPTSGPERRLSPRSPTAVNRAHDILTMTSPRSGDNSSSPEPYGGMSPRRARKLGASGVVQFEIDSTSLDDIQRVESEVSLSKLKTNTVDEKVENFVHTYSLSQLPVVESFCATGGEHAASIYVNHGKKGLAQNAAQSFHSTVLLDVFSWIEHRWVAWGCRPIAFHDFITSEQKHHLIRLSQTRGAPKCHVCGQNPAAWACPPKEMRIECPDRKYACQSCYNQGVTYHIGLLEGDNREFKLSALKAIFEQADTHHYGALDFMEYLFFTFSMVYIRRNWCDYRPDKQLKSIWDEMTKIKELYVRWADSPEVGLDYPSLLRLLEEIDLGTPDDIEGLFKQHADLTGHLIFRGFVEILYGLMRPDSEFHQSQPRISLPRPKITSKPRTPQLRPPNFDHFDPRNARQHKLLGEGSSTFAWLVHYTNYQMCAKTPKPNISKREIEDMMEAARLQKLVQHNNVLRVLAIHHNPTSPCILLELAQGGDLSLWQMYDVERPLQLRVLSEVALGVAALHANNPCIIHRDIKGRNILLTSEHEVKITDFDFAVVVRNATAKTSGVCGTPGYMAPEVLLDKEYYASVDVFSFASLMYEVTHKRHPFSLEVEKMADEIRRPSDFANSCAQLTKDGIRPSLDPALCPSKMRALIMECWDADARNRPTMAAVVQRLAAMESQFAESYQLPDTEEAKRGRRLGSVFLGGLSGLGKLTLVDIILLSAVVLLVAILVAKFA